MMSMRNEDMSQSDAFAIQDGSQMIDVFRYVSITCIYKNSPENKIGTLVR